MMSQFLESVSNRLHPKCTSIACLYFFLIRVSDCIRDNIVDVPEKDIECAHGSMYIDDVQKCIAIS